MLQRCWDVADVLAAALHQLDKVRIEHVSVAVTEPVHFVFHLQYWRSSIMILAGYLASVVSNDEALCAGPIVLVVTDSLVELDQELRVNTLTLAVDLSASVVQKAHDA